jgi:hypothetical protein
MSIHFSTTNTRLQQSQRTGLLRLRYQLLFLASLNRRAENVVIEAVVIAELEFRDV